MHPFVRNALLALILALPGSMVSSPAFAASVQFATCGASGCTCRVSNDATSTIETQVPSAFPTGWENQTLVVHDGKYFWSSLSPAQLDRKYGGSGSCPLQVFHEFTPEDGLWQISVGTTDTSACKMVAGQVPGGMTSQTRQITWNGVFHPETLFMEARGMFRWTETGRLNWRGVLADETMSANGGTSGASVVQTVRMISPTEVTGSSVFEYDLAIPGLDAAAASVIAGMQCKTVTPFTARKVG